MLVEKHQWKFKISDECTMKLVVLKHCKSELHCLYQPGAWRAAGKTTRQDWDQQWTAQPQTPGTFTGCRTFVVLSQYLQHLSRVKDKSDCHPTNAQLFINISYICWLSKYAHLNWGIKSWHSDIAAIKLRSLKLRHSTWSFWLTPSWKLTREGSHFCSFIFWEQLCHLSYWFCRAKQAQRKMDQSLSYLVYYATWLLCSRQWNKDTLEMTQSKRPGLYLSDGNNINKQSDCARLT